MTWVLSKLGITGVKGVLTRSGEFNLQQKGNKARSVAIFGRNGHGKSGYADALEYLFSIDGEVEHLGKGGSDSERGGKHAIPHVLASEKGITPQIEAEFLEVETGRKVTAVRPVVTGRIDHRPVQVTQVLSEAPAHRILRQHDLRRFVVDMEPSRKFEEFSRWTGLEAVSGLLRHLTTAENSLSNTDVDREITERVRSVSNHTQNAVTGFDKTAILKWCEDEARKHAPQVAPIGSVDDIDLAVASLRQQREAVLLRAKAELYSAKNNLGSNAQRISAEEGMLVDLSTKFEAVFVANKALVEAREGAKESVFQALWQSADALFKQEQPPACPICQTPWADSKIGSIEQTVLVLRERLQGLSEFSALDHGHSQAREAFSGSITDVIQMLGQIRADANTLGLQIVVDKALSLETRLTELRQEQSLTQVSSEFDGCIKDCRQLCGEEIPKHLSGVGDTVAPAGVTAIDSSVGQLEGLKEAVSRLEQLEELRRSIRLVESEFKKIAGEIRIQTQAMVQAAVTNLKADVQEIYRKVHPGEAVPEVFFDLDADQKTLILRVNFYSPDRRVPPGGYLSESQINTLGLALFLASVRLFNKSFPFVVLDDIVSSYDADNRARVVDVIAEYLDGFQVFLTTHDEQFYKFLRNRLEGKDWMFERLTGFDIELGPRRDKDNLGPGEINELITSGNEHLAGNGVRQFMEEWFDGVCEKYEVGTLHKRGGREYNRTLFDYWPPFLDKLSRLGTDVSSRVLNSRAVEKMKVHPLINYYSHYQANPYEWPSMGDVKYVWEAFQDFTALFNCYSCSTQLKYDSDKSRLYCTCGRPIFPTP